ncbi:hypothetical protein [Qipengyuania marisflavi]|uniref:Uncharacterized protein n=1 Tax=Qipengyuania marisflavi TaxID=2486356 RepID=A0A5S3P1V6_9SPHN|nr:hypothetical protein [Qipengyuania marisflavi]TMM45871.1 hypothetical protein FEV51_12340 [Qipengyuania marisflavi]
MTMLLALSLLAVQADAPAPPPAVTMAPAPLPIQQQTALRCSVAIAMAAERQRMGNGADPSWPDLRERGREFFVQSLAKLMDETGMTREGLALQAGPVVAELQQPGKLAEIIPACLMMLDASGL